MIGGVGGECGGGVSAGVVRISAWKAAEGVAR